MAERVSAIRGNVRRLVTAPTGRPCSTIAATTSATPAFPSPSIHKEEWRSRTTCRTTNTSTRCDRGCGPAAVSCWPTASMLTNRRGLRPSGSRAPAKRRSRPGPVPPPSPRPPPPSRPSASRWTSSFTSSPNRPHRRSTIGPEPSWAGSFARPCWTWPVPRPESKPTSSAVRMCGVFMGRKPYAFLNYQWEDGELVEEFVNKSLCFGIFASTSTNFFTGVAYENHPQGYLRDEKLLAWYVPLVRRLSQAGWEPGARCGRQRPGRLLREVRQRRYGLFHALQRLEDQDRLHDGHRPWIAGIFSRFRSPGRDRQEGQAGGPARAACVLIWSRNEPT